jgi:uncharacterized protein YuzE
MGTLNHDSWFDPEIDALYVRLLEGVHNARRSGLDKVALNIGENEQLVGIEILDAKEVLGQGLGPRKGSFHRPGKTCRLLLDRALWQPKSTLLAQDPGEGFH